MPTEILGANLGHQRSAGAASGVSMTTSSAFTPFHRGTEHIDLIPRNFSGAAVARYALCPYLVILKADSSTDLAGSIADYSTIAQDGSTATSVELSSLAAGRNVYVGSAIPFRGVHIDVDTTNSTGSTVITVSYWNGSEWVDTSDTDGTISGGISLAQDGAITWTVPSAWVSSSLVKIDSSVNSSLHWRDVSMYWTKWTWDQAMDSTVTLDHMLGINESTAYAEVPASLGTGMRIHHGFGSNGIAGIETLTNAGTGNMLVTCSALNGYFSTGKLTTV
jgi:hypothetical protein